MYLDTSTLGRVLLAEPDAPAVLDALRAFDQHVASRLMRLELRRLGLRNGIVDRADELLAAVALVPVDETVLAAAEAVRPATVGTLDAIHLATALRVAHAGMLDALMTYDAALARAAVDHGLTVLRPD